MKKIFIFTLTLFMVLTMSACKASLNSVKYVTNYIEEKGGENIRFEDFAYLNHKDEGSGRIVEVYELEDNNKLLLMGYSYDERPARIEIITKDNERKVLYDGAGEDAEDYFIYDVVEMPETINSIKILKDADVPYYYDTLELDKNEFDNMTNWLSSLILIESNDPIAEGYVSYEFTINDEIIFEYTMSAGYFIIYEGVWYKILSPNSFFIEDEVFEDLIAGNK